MELTERHLGECRSSRWDFSDLKALFLNCTLKRTPEISHTEGLIAISKAIMEQNKVRTEVLRPVDYNIAYGVYPDMKDKGWEAMVIKDLNGMPAAMLIFQILNIDKS